jgi:hypothetical protein
VADAPRRWRLRRASNQGSNLLSTVFAVLLGNATSMQTNYAPLAHLLGATVLYCGLEPNWKSLGGVTHVFCGPGYVRGDDVPRGLAWLAPEWLVQCILQVRMLSVQEHRCDAKKK